MRFRVLHPIDRIGRPVTTYVHMTVLAVRPATGTGRRFGRSDESRRTHMEQLRERIELDELRRRPAQGRRRDRPPAPDGARAV